MPKMYQFGGESMYFAGRWNGYAMPTYRAATERAMAGYETYPTEQFENGGVSLLSTGPERAQLNDGPNTGLGDIFTFSQNEKILVMAALAGVTFWALGGAGWVKRLVKR